MEKLRLARTQAKLPAGGVDQCPTVCRGLLLQAIADPPDRTLEFHVLQRPLVTTHPCHPLLSFPGLFKNDPAALLR
ncbi:MAG: hypothetical protein ACHQ7N_20110 [Candidatus Methylomirabilales bacterium]